MLTIPDQIKELLKEECRVAFIVDFPNGDGDTIDPQNIVSETVRFKERVCSQRSIRYGLCEASSLEFTASDIDNISNKTIMASIGVDVSELQNVQDYETDPTITFPFYRIRLGTFVVKKCPRQANDMTKRKVVAYSYYQTTFDTVSPFEHMKITLPSKTKTNYTYNPIKYVLANVSQNVDLDLEALGYFDGSSSLASELVDTTEEVWSNGANIGMWGMFSKIVMKTMRLDLTDYTAWPHLLAYRMGSNLQITAEELIEQIREDFADIINLQLDAAADFLHPYAAISGTFQNTAVTQYCNNLRNAGFVDPVINGVTAVSYYIDFPYAMEVQVYSKMDVQTVLVRTITYDLYDKTKINIVSSHTSQTLRIPDISQTISRVKVKSIVIEPRYASSAILLGTGYLVAEEDLPETTDLFKALLELNGYFLKQDRITNKYRLLQLHGVGAAIYPSDDLYPGEDVYPDGGDEEITMSDYEQLWYDDEAVAPYTEIRTTYLDANGEESLISVYQKRYAETTKQLLTQAVTGDRHMVIDLSIDNPIENDMTIRVDLGGLVITAAYADRNGAVLIDIDVGEYCTSFDWKASNWQDATALYISFDPDSAEAGESYTATIRSVTREEVTYDHKVMDLSDNAILQAYHIDDDELEDLLEDLLEKVGDVIYMPVELQARGFPYIEAGDTLEIETKDQLLYTIVLQRTLTGIQALHDNFISD